MNASEGQTRAILLFGGNGDACLCVPPLDAAYTVLEVTGDVLRLADPTDRLPRLVVTGLERLAPDTHTRMVGREDMMLAEVVNQRRVGLRRIAVSRLDPEQRPGPR